MEIAVTNMKIYDWRTYVLNLYIPVKCNAPLNGFIARDMA